MHISVNGMQVPGAGWEEMNETKRKISVKW